jgi:hypothetical protein
MGRPGRAVVVLAMRIDASAALTVRKTGTHLHPKCRRKIMKETATRGSNPRMRLDAYQGRGERRGKLDTWCGICQKDAAVLEFRDGSGSRCTVAQCRVSGLGASPSSVYSAWCACDYRHPPFNAESCDSSILFPRTTFELPDSNHQTSPDPPGKSLPSRILRFLPATSAYSQHLARRSSTAALSLTVASAQFSGRNCVRESRDRTRLSTDTTTLQASQ